LLDGYVWKGIFGETLNCFLKAGIAIVMASDAEAIGLVKGDDFNPGLRSLQDDCVEMAFLGGNL
jgi:hypothetical protein